MFLEESQWVAKKIKEMGNIQKILDIGSGDLEYRCKKQIYISDMYDNIGLHIETLDFSGGEGIDYVRDITTVGGIEDLYGYDVVLVCNLLEHISSEKVSVVLDNIYALLREGGYCIVTVPFNIGFHPSPIDSGFRPDVNELEGLFQNRFKTIAVEKIVCSHYREPYISNPNLLPLPEVTCGVFRKF